MNHADMLMLVRTFQSCTPIPNLRRLVATHAPDATGHCPLCHSRGCTLRAGAQAALDISRPAR